MGVRTMIHRTATLSATAVLFGLVASTMGGSNTGPEPDEQAIDGAGHGEEILFVVLVPDEPARTERIVDLLSDASGQPAASIHAELHTLWREFAGIYLQFDGVREPIDLVFRPTSGDEVFTDASRMTMRLRGGGADQVAVIWVDDPERTRYQVYLPETASHVTVAANGRTVVSAEPLPTEIDSHTITIDAAGSH